MSDDDRIRSLLTLAADLPDDVQPPVTSVLDRGRRRRRLRAAVSVLGAAVVVAAAFALPAVLRSPGANPLVKRVPPEPTATGPTVAQLASYHWSARPPSPLGRRSDPLLAWTGHWLIELGGTRVGQTEIQDGASYDAATGRWHRIAPVPPGLDLSIAQTTSAGQLLFVANGQAQPYRTRSNRGTAALYNPAANRWTVIGLPHELLGAVGLRAAWNGREVVVASVGERPGDLHVAAYDLATRRWQLITPSLPQTHPPVDATLVAVPGRVLLWSLWSKSTKVSRNGYSVASGVDVLSLGRHGWTAATARWPQHQTVDSPVYAGDAIFLAPSQIWCGLCSHPGVELRSRLVSPAALAITEIPAGPLARQPGIQPDLWLWTGRVAIAASTSGKSALSMRVSQLAAFDPPTNSWHHLPAPPRDAIATAPAWAGRQLFLLTSAGALWTFHR